MRTGWTSALSAFLDPVQLADHPGDRLSYRHFAMTRLAGAKYPGGIPTAEEISAEFSAAISRNGLVGTLHSLRAMLPEDPSAAWNEGTERCFRRMLLLAREFEGTMRSDTRYSDFPAYLKERI